MSYPQQREFCRRVIEEGLPDKSGLIVDGGGNERAEELCACVRSWREVIERVTSQSPSQNENIIALRRW